MIEWAQRVLGEHMQASARALEKFGRKPKSARRLHRARKRLARLRAAIEDLGSLAGAEPAFSQRVERLHKRAGKVRDADVWIARLRDYGKRAEGAEREQIAALCERLGKRRKRMRAKFVRELQR